MTDVAKSRRDIPYSVCNKLLFAFIGDGISKAPVTLYMRVRTIVFVLVSFWALTLICLGTRIFTRDYRQAIVVFIINLMWTTLLSMIRVLRLFSFNNAEPERSKHQVDSQAYVIGNIILMISMIGIEHEIIMTGGVGDTSIWCSFCIGPLCAMLTGSRTLCVLWSLAMMVQHVFLMHAWLSGHEWPMRRSQQALVELSVMSGICVHIMYMLIGICLVNFVEEFQRVSKIDVEDLAEANSRLKRAFAAQRDFTAVISHEIRTPVGHMMTSAELLHLTSLSSTQAEFVNNVTQSGDVLMALLSSILDFSKAHAQGIQIENRLVTLHSLIADVLNVLSITAFTKGIELVADIAHNVPKQVIGDCTRLTQVLINLVNNAIKFTSCGYVHINVSLVDNDSSPASSSLLFEVKDTGIGLTAEAQRVVFDAYSQAETSTSRRFGGTGLGLSISTSIIKAMNGVLRVRSAGLGHGSSFYFVIPLRHPKPSQLSLSNDTLQISEKSFRQYKRCRILIVDRELSSNNIANSLVNNFSVEQSNTYFHAPQFNAPLCRIDVYICGSVPCNNSSDNNETPNSDTSRWHSIVLALSMGIPVLLITTLLDLVHLRARMLDEVKKLSSSKVKSVWSIITKPLIAEKLRTSVYQLLRDRDSNTVQPGQTADSNDEYVPVINEQLQSTAETVFPTQLSALNMSDGISKQSSACVTRQSAILEQFQHSSIHFLVIDDCLMNCKLMCQVLKTAGFTSQSCLSGRIGLELLEQHNFTVTQPLSESLRRFDCVITDVQMPEMDGFTVSRAIRNIENTSKCFFPPIMVVACTAGGTDDIKARCFASGMTSVVYKPFTKSILADILCVYSKRTSESGNLSARNAEGQENQVPDIRDAKEDANT